MHINIILYMYIYILNSILATANDVKNNDKDFDK